MTLHRLKPGGRSVHVRHEASKVDKHWLRYLDIDNLLPLLRIHDDANDLWVCLQFRMFQVNTVDGFQGNEKAWVKLPFLQVLHVPQR